jgi:dTDP-glucose pyrophosphorylase
MTILITMAGLGSRFRQVGYKVPKYMIEVKGKTLFEWSLVSLENFKQPENQYIFIVRKEDDAKVFLEQKCTNIGIHNFTVLELEAMTDGQATTAILAQNLWDKDSELLIYNIDTYVEMGEMRPEQIKGDGFIPCFHAPGNHWSFVKLDDKGNAVEVREKQRISDNCTLGAYYFKTCSLYEKLYNEYYGEGGNMECGEKYIAPLYNYLISKGGQINISVVDFNKVHVLGTPEELEIFKEFSEATIDERESY